MKRPNPLVFSLILYSPFPFHQRQAPSRCRESPPPVIKQPKPAHPPPNPFLPPFRLIATPYPLLLPSSNMLHGLPFTPPAPTLPSHTPSPIHLIATPYPLLLPSSNILLSLPFTRLLQPSHPIHHLQSTLSKPTLIVKVHHRVLRTSGVLTPLISTPLGVLSNLYRRVDITRSLSSLD